jgi:membrane protein
VHQVSDGSRTARRPGVLALLGAYVRSVSEHHTLLAAGGVAFNFAIALVPAVVSLVSLYGLIAEPDEVATQLEPLTNALPSEAADLVVTQLRNVTSISTGEVTIGLVIGALGLAWLVSNAFNSLVIAIRIAHGRKSPHNWLQGRLFAIRLSIFALAVTTIVLWSLLALPRTLDAAGLGDRARDLLSIARWPLVLLFVAGSLQWIYRTVLGPAVSLTARHIAVFIGGAIWVVGTVLMAMAASGADELQATFGTLGAVAVLLGWLYLSACAVLLAAEAESVLAGRLRRTKRGRRRRGENEERHAEPGEGGQDDETGAIAAGDIGQHPSDEGAEGGAEHHDH